MSRLAALDPLTLNQMRAAGLSDSEIEQFLALEDRAEKARYGAKASSAQMQLAMRALRDTGAPPTLLRAYVEARVRPSRILQDLTASATFRGGRLSLDGQAADRLTSKLKAEPPITTAGIWAQYRAAAAAHHQGDRA